MNTMIYNQINEVTDKFRFTSSFKIFNSIHDKIYELDEVCIKTNLKAKLEEILKNVNMSSITANSLFDESYRIDFSKFLAEYLEFRSKYPDKFNRIKISGDHLSESQIFEYAIEHFSILYNPFMDSHLFHLYGFFDIDRNIYPNRNDLPENYIQITDRGTRVAYVCLSDSIKNAFRYKVRIEDNRAFGFYGKLSYNKNLKTNVLMTNQFYH